MMNQKLLIVVLSVVLALVHRSGTAAALGPAGGIAVLHSEVHHSFAQHVTFSLAAKSDSDIVQVYLFYRSTGDEHAVSVQVEIDPAPEIDVSYVHDAGADPLPPFADIRFWWQIEDAAGDQEITEPQQFAYTDNRFEWHELRAETITIKWIQDQGDPAFGQAALDVAQATVQELASDLQTPPPPETTVYIYDSQYNLDGAMVLAGRDWVGGQAHPELGVVVVAIPPEQGYRSLMMRDIPHELTHLVVYEAVTPLGYPYVPEWLDEGLATASERQPTPEYATALEGARNAGHLIPLEELCVPFAPDAQRARLAYAESASLVRFIRERYGADGIRALLQAYADGASCTSGVREALGTSFSGLEAAWLANLAPEAPWRPWMDQVGIWVGLWLLSLLVAVPMVGGLRRR
jgi:hypothetical protein